MKENNKVTQLDVVVVGAGFAGLYLLYRLRSLGLSVRVLEAGSGVGGVWFWNRYPGARCDVESVDYSYSFSPELQAEWKWTERYATQPEILRYLDHVADRFDLLPDVELNTKVSSAKFDEDQSVWKVESADGKQYLAKYCIMATGPLSVPIQPKIPGLENFNGEVYHTGSWPEKKVSFSGKRVGLIGTGSSGIQATPAIAEDAKHLYVFQRTANYSIPAQNHVMDEKELSEIKYNYQERRKAQRNSAVGNYWSAVYSNRKSAMEVSEGERVETFQKYWELGGPAFMVSFKDIATDLEANETAAKFVRDKIKSIVKDPEVAEKLIPSEDLPIGCKRICVDINYHATFNRDNVSLVDVKERPIEAATATGIKTTMHEYALDVIILATGFDAMTGALARVDIRGRKGKKLLEKWVDGPINYLGLGVNEFPNMFIVNGPGSPSVTANLVVSSELQTDWIARLILQAKRTGKEVIEPTEAAEKSWVQRVNEIASHTVFTAGCDSWFVGANIPGKPRLFTAFAGGLNAYFDICEEVENNGYEGFSFTEPVRSTVY